MSFSCFDLELFQRSLEKVKNLSDFSQNKLDSRYFTFCDDFITNSKYILHMEVISFLSLPFIARVDKYLYYAKECSSTNFPF